MRCAQLDPALLDAAASGGGSKPGSDSSAQLLRPDPSDTNSSLTFIANPAAAEGGPDLTPYRTKLAIGVSREAVEHMMRSAQLDPALLDGSSIFAASGGGSKPGVSSVESALPGQERASIAAPAADNFAAAMAAAAAARAARAAQAAATPVPDTRITETPRDSADADRDAWQPVPAAEEVKCKGHVLLRKYFKMLRDGVPKDTIQSDMCKQGLLPELIDLDPDSSVPAVIYLKDKFTVGSKWRGGGVSRGGLMDRSVPSDDEDDDDDDDDEFGS
jgi:hypothetical protein